MVCRDAVTFLTQPQPIWRERKRGKKCQPAPEQISNLMQYKLVYGILLEPIASLVTVWTLRSFKKKVFFFYEDGSGSLTGLLLYCLRATEWRRPVAVPGSVCVPYGPAAVDVLFDLLFCVNCLQPLESGATEHFRHTLCGLSSVLWTDLFFGTKPLVLKVKVFWTVEGLLFWVNQIFKFTFMFGRWRF